MDGEWTWDETLYAGSAPYYVTGRMPYPEALAQCIVQELEIDALVSAHLGPVRRAVRSRRPDPRSGEGPR